MWILGWKGASGFSACSTAEAVTNGVDATGLTAIVTGSSSGIGVETARVLAMRGAHVVMAVRNVDAGRSVKEAILKEIPTAKVDVMQLDLNSMASVKKFASEYVSSGLPLNLLINNAGIMMCPYMLSADNIELQFATNHVGHRWCNKEGIRFEKINNEAEYNNIRAYGQAKLANILHANELARRFKLSLFKQAEGVNITANSLHPGVIATNLYRHTGVIARSCNYMLCGTASTGASGFSARSTAEQVTNGIDATGLTAVVTGASSGIGVETARVLAMRGAHVVMAVRNVDTGKSVKEAILKEIPTAKVDVMQLDLSSMASVKKFASEYISSGLPLNLLINNAGIMMCPYMLSTDNIEMQFATNHVGHFLLTHLLLETMKSTARESNQEGRIVNLSSEGHRFAYKEGIRFDKINNEAEYNNIRAYGQSKLANILHANELARRLKEEGINITANSLHPGAIATNLLRHSSFLEGSCNYMLCGTASTGEGGHR
ncbi:unnamed protein product [Linum tenue]|uniref:Short-chain dehydrogenase TIC 32, chloroplastic n=1 Tax=Linum tenue TaxID=586396 RepID=A0AAV0K4N6_9ROSI|nr:unnamed protein product [Linum tenue]